MKDNTPSTEEWRDYRFFVIATLNELKDTTKTIVTSLDDMKTSAKKDINDLDDKVTEKINTVDKRLTIIETKSVIFGSIAGLLVTLAPKIMDFFLK